jgi:NAD(P)-dependent dehydrogenase (short-subunit alcohol dehydrogenase family)
MIVGELAKELDASAKPRVVINTVNPGFCDTDLWRNAPWPLNSIIGFVARFVARTSEMGSRTLMWAVFAGDQSHGRYTGDCMLRDESNFVKSEEGYIIGRKVFGELLTILDPAAPGIAQNI